MLQKTSAAAGRDARPDDRRIHPRIPSSQLGITGVKVRNSQGGDLVDLSAGGALLQLPYQLKPDSRIPIQLDAGGKKLELPLQLLRCYVVDLRGGVKYHAAGAFDQPLNLDALTQTASTTMARMMASLERLELGVRKTALQSRSDEQFHQTLLDLISWLRQDESIDLVVLKLKARLTQSYRSLLIIPARTPAFDRATTLECFGMTFKAKNPLSAQDRRFLKAHAHLISILEDTRRALRDEDARPQSSLVVHSAAEWQATQSQIYAAPPQRTVVGPPVLKSSSKPAPVVALPAKPSPAVALPAKPAAVAEEEFDFFSALKIDPAFA
jgi:hypothetical protein